MSIRVKVADLLIEYPQLLTEKSIQPEATKPKTSNQLCKNVLEKPIGKRASTEDAVIKVDNTTDEDINKLAQVIVQKQIKIDS